jgi:hypothetical protein
MPAKSISTHSEFYTELCKAIGSISDLNHNPNMNMYSYNVRTDSPNTESNFLYNATSMSKNFMLGLDLEVFANADKNSIYSGFNSLNDDIFAQLVFDGLDLISLHCTIHLLYVRMVC